MMIMYNVQLGKRSSYKQSAQWHLLHVRHAISWTTPSGSSHAQHLLATHRYDDCGIAWPATSSMLNAYCLTCTVTGSMVRAGPRWPVQMVCLQCRNSGCGQLKDALRPLGPAVQTPAAGALGAARQPASRLLLSVQL